MEKIIPPPPPQTTAPMSKRDEDICLMILLYKLQGLDASYYNDVAISVKNILVAMWGFLKKKNLNYFVWVFDLCRLLQLI